MPDITRRDMTRITAGAAIAGAIASSPQLANAANEGVNMDIQRDLIQQPASGAPYISVAPIISLGAAHQGVVYLSGITADPARPGDIKNQTKQVLDRIDRLLGKAGTDKSKLLSAQIWLTDMAHFEDHNAAWNEWVDPRNPPVRACLLSPQLWYSGLLVEIMVIAAK